MSELLGRVPNHECQSRLSSRQSSMVDEAPWPAENLFFEPVHPAMHGYYMSDRVRKIDFVLVYYTDDDREEENVIQNGSLNPQAAVPQRNGDQFKEEPVDAKRLEVSNKARRTCFQDNLIKQGCQIESEQVKEGDDVKTLTFVKIHVPLNVVAKHAETLKIKTPFRVKTSAIESFSDQPNNEGETVIYHPFSRKLFKRCTAASAKKDTSAIGPSQERVNQSIRPEFENRHRIEVAWSILQETPNHPTDLKKRGIESLLEHKVYLAAYPLHEGGCHLGEKTNKAPLNVKAEAVQFINPRLKLRREWANWSKTFRMQPLDDVRAYFGEKIGFYFVFMDFYVKMLIPPTIIGILVLVYGFATTAANEELTNVCGESAHDRVDGVSNESDHINSHEFSSGASEIWICPVCRPPNCHVQAISHEFCTQYGWAWILDNDATTVIAISITLWSILFLKYWRRHEARMAFHWSTHDSEEYDLLVRPAYEEKAVEARPNPVTLENEPYISPGTVLFKVFVSYTFTLLMVCTMIGILALLIISRIALYGTLNNLGGIFSEKNVEFSRWLVHGLIFVTVSLSERFFHAISDKLTEFECPKTDCQFMKSFLWKLFIFQQMNDFVPIAYSAWLKGRTASNPLKLNMFSELCGASCMDEVTELVSVLLLARLVVGNIAEVLVPMTSKFIEDFKLKRVKQKLAKSQPAEALKEDIPQVTTLPQWQTDFHLNEAELDGVYSEYMEMMIQFAFICLFSPAFPAAAAVCFLNNIAEIRVDACNILQTNRRPLPIRVPGIQIWNQFMDIIIKAGILSNAALISFTSDHLPYLYYKNVIEPTSDGMGYLNFSLSRVFLSDWPELRAEYYEKMVSANITMCYYVGFRDDHEPFDLKDVYWPILALRLSVFCAYCLISFTVMWLINTCIDDVPADVRTQIKRQNFWVQKARETDQSSGAIKWASRQMADNFQHLRLTKSRQRGSANSRKVVPLA